MTGDAGRNDPVGFDAGPAGWQDGARCGKFEMGPGIAEGWKDGKGDGEREPPVPNGSLKYRNQIAELLFH
jgi:hypothetical protein